MRTIAIPLFFLMACGGAQGPSSATPDEHASEHEHHHGEDGHGSEHEHHHGEDGHASDDLESTRAAPPEASPSEATPETAAETPWTHELLVLHGFDCEWHNAWRPPRRVPCDESVRALYREKNGVWSHCRTLDAGDAGSDYEHRTLLRGRIRAEVFTVRRRQSLACHIEEVAVQIEANEHELFPLSAQHFGPVRLDATETQQEPVDAHYEVVRRRSGLVLWAAAWLSDLPNEWAIRGQSTLQRDELEARLRNALEGARSRIGRQDYFAPEVADRRMRIAMALTPVLYDRETRVQAIPLCRTGELHFRVVQMSRIAGSIRRSLWRSVIRSAVLEHGARPWREGGCSSPPASL